MQAFKHGRCGCDSQERITPGDSISLLQDTNRKRQWWMRTACAEQIANGKSKATDNTRLHQTGLIAHGIENGKGIEPEPKKEPFKNPWLLEDLLCQDV